VPVFLEKFLLPLAVALVALIAGTNPMKFDWTQRVTGGLAIVFMAYFIAHTVHQHNLARATTVPAANTTSIQDSKSDRSSKEDRPRPLDPQTSAPHEEQKAQIRKKVMEEKSNRSVNIGPNSSVTNSPIVTGDNVVVQTDIPEPTLDLKSLIENQALGDLFKSEFMLTIDAKVAINSLYLEVKAPTITKMEVVPQRSGLLMSGHSGLRDGFAFTNLTNAYGTYKITVYSKNHEKFEVIYDY
jgi:hypothetical protein